MRDIFEYPITLTEIAKCLSEISFEIQNQDEITMACGNMRGLLVDKAYKIIAAISSVIENTSDNDHDSGGMKSDFEIAEMIRKILK